MIADVLPRGVPGRTHCGSWRPSPDWQGGCRLACNLPPHLDELHHSSWSGWWWRKGEPLMREWACGGCKTPPRISSEDSARAAGWRVHRSPNGVWDAMCPRCGKPDRGLVKLCAELSVSAARTPFAEIGESR